LVLWNKPQNDITTHVSQDATTSNVSFRICSVWRIRVKPWRVVLTDMAKCAVTNLSCMPSFFPNLLVSYISCSHSVVGCQNILVPFQLLRVLGQFGASVRVCGEVPCRTMNVSHWAPCPDP